MSFSLELERSDSTAAAEALKKPPKKKPKVEDLDIDFCSSHYP